ncbi:MAG: Cytochrome oxidase biogenesis protein Surf1, facilitates heme A insertion [uncultured Sphingomonadaceae bacterium]|uniref:SURF1-like protein n=1 Tax=uncultured Sphingomonadaceae bacterium TaxID=169976 RepID=A0A6J4SKY6_9SPHN|nr:MAG: Cytochrome oxidase biogenesis protein Surf1, facilitates heme A insertion [uncultured Sphingomonadaceae bacterium]
MKLPFWPTLLVALAVATMLGLGLWQLDRAGEKRAQIAQLRSNPAVPPIAFPRFPDERLLFRRASGHCLEVARTSTEGAGASGFRVIAECRTGGLEGPGMLVQLGTTRDPRPVVRWPGGEVAGYLSYAPDNRSMLSSLVGGDNRRLMLVSAAPLAGLAPNTPPDVSSVPNNHSGYALQWFFFAAAAALIYALALRRRGGTPAAKGEAF